MAMLSTLSYFLVAVLVIPSGFCAPKSKGSSRTSGPQTVYDQKQTGDYNIQLHLKDFQIIALLGDDLSAIGDYDYNYDYSDFTIKPSTPKPSTEASSLPGKPSSTSKPTTPKPTNITSNSTTTPPQEPLLHPKPYKEQPNSANTTTVPSGITEEVVQIVESSTPGVAPSDKIEEINSPGKIKVQIIETPVGVVPGELTDGVAGHGEVMQVRRCALGYTRDKRGRCRRVRRPSGVAPHIQYGIGRLATNLASRFRYTSSDDSASSSSSSLSHSEED